MTDESRPGEAAADQPYSGPERRKGGDRRQVNSRREEFRFEPGKEDRRRGTDRRKRGDKLVDFGADDVIIGVAAL